MTIIIILFMMIVIYFYGEMRQRSHSRRSLPKTCTLVEYVWQIDPLVNDREDDCPTTQLPAANAATPSAAACGHRTASGSRLPLASHMVPLDSTDAYQRISAVQCWRCRASRCRKHHYYSPGGCSRFAVRGRTLQRAPMVREYQVCRMEDAAPGADRVSDRFCRTLLGPTLGVHL